MATGVWADSAYQSKKNETMFERCGLISHLHRKKPNGKPMPETVKRGNATRSKVRAFIEHPFADQKHRMGLKITTIGIERATIKIGIANIAYNIRRPIMHKRRAAAT